MEVLIMPDPDDALVAIIVIIAPDGSMFRLTGRLAPANEESDGVPRILISPTDDFLKDFSRVAPGDTLSILMDELNVGEVVNLYPGEHIVHLD